MSWDSLSELQTKLDSNDRSVLYNKKYCQLVASVFETTDGKRLLESWGEMLLKQTTYDPNAPKSTIFINEGQHNFIRHIMTSIQLHQHTLGATNE